MRGAGELRAIGGTLGMFHPYQDDPGDGRRDRRRGLTGAEQDGRANRQPRKRSEPDRAAFSESSHCLFVSEFRANSRLGEPFCVTRGRPKEAKMRSIIPSTALRLTTFFVNQIVRAQ